LGLDRHRLGRLKRRPDRVKRGVNFAMRYRNHLMKDRYQMHYYLEPVPWEEGLSVGASHFWSGGGAFAAAASETVELDADGTAYEIVGDASGDSGEEEVVLPAPDEIAPRARALWDKSITRRALSNMLRRMRQKRGLSQSDVAKRLGTSQPVIARMESASGPWPSQDRIAAFSNACDYLVGLCFLNAGGGSEAQLEESADAGTASDALFLPLGEPCDLPHSDLLGRFGLELGDVYEIVAEPTSSVPEENR
jgi:transcriptional regulator with XRE-family HTH domain